MKEAIKETIVDQVEIDDLDMIVEDELLGENPEGHECEWIRDGNRWSWEEHVSITTLEKTIKLFKEKGATHVQIDSNGDHHSYTFTGTKLEMLTQGDIKEREKEELEKAINDSEKTLKNMEGDVDKRKVSLQEKKDKLSNLNN